MDVLSEKNLLKKRIVRKYTLHTIGLCGSLIAVHFIFYGLRPYLVNFEPWQQTVGQILSIFVVVFIVLAWSFFSFSRFFNYLNISILDPLLNIGELAKDITLTLNYRLRAKSEPFHEIRSVAKNFNELLDSLEKRDEMLLKIHEALESRMMERTKALEEEIIIRKNTESLLTQSEKKFRIIVENTSDAILVTAADGTIEYLSPAAKDVVGYSPEDLIGKRNYKIYHSEDEEKVVDAFKKATYEGKSGSLEYRVVDKIGNTRWISHSWSPVIVNHRLERVISIIRDETKRKKTEIEKDNLQKQLIQASKMASLGTLGAGIAHELNNPLAVIHGFNEQLLEMTDGGNVDISKIKNYSEKIAKQTNRMRVIINHIREFSRDENRPKRIKKSANDIINDSLILLRQQIVNHGIDLILELNPAIPEFWVDPIRMESVYQNLLTNSKDAFEGKNIDNKFVKISTDLSYDNRYIVVRVEDNAGGIPAGLLDRIFDPFFTTKDIGKGTGLGLSLVHSIVEEHKGQIRVCTDEGKGTTFEIKIPVDVRTIEDGRPHAK